MRKTPDDGHTIPFFYRCSVGDTLYFAVNMIYRYKAVGGMPINDKRPKTHGFEPFVYDWPVLLNDRYI